MNYVKHDIIFDKDTCCYVGPLLIIFIIDHVNGRTISVINERKYVNAMMYDRHDSLVVSLT